ncbi:UNVERIFIED_CONTAM: hypothetical protein K2H54_043822 [Gekko kuhli]
MSLREAFSDIQLTSLGPGMLRPGENLNLVCKVKGVSITRQSYPWNWSRQSPGKGVLSQVVLTESAPAVKKPGESHKLSCAITGFDMNSYTMSWIMQKPGKALEWLLWYYSPGSANSGYSPAIQGRFTASKDSSNFYLQMDSLKAEDTAVYYCARLTQ